MTGFDDSKSSIGTNEDTWKAQEKEIEGSG